ncbi:MAG: hypothetical protein K940chlam5_00664 [Candidatus Anoxychlamydiales bacterium]|nr:hypothetical protein [Candidatus Anoxychlamydiales bacterium]
MIGLKVGNILIKNNLCRYFSSVFFKPATSQMFTKVYKPNNNAFKNGLRKRAIANLSVSHKTENYSKSSQSITRFVSSTNYGFKGIDFTNKYLWALSLSALFSFSSNNNKKEEPSLEITGDDLKDIASIFDIDKNLKFNKLKENCFNEVYDACKNNDDRLKNEKFNRRYFSILENENKQTLAAFALDSNDIQTFKNIYQIDKDTCFNAIWEKCESEGVKKVRGFGEKWKQEDNLTENPIISITNTSKDSLLLRACKSKNKKIASKILKYGLHLKKDEANASEESKYLLHLVVTNGWSELIKPLIGLDYKKDLRGAHRDTALHIAIREDKVECLEVLLDLKVDTGLKTNFEPSSLKDTNITRVTPIFLAIGLGREECFIELLKREKNLDQTLWGPEFKKEESLDKGATSLEGSSLLHWAIWQGKSNMIELCLSKNYISKFKGMMQKKDAQGRSLVHIAAFKGETDTLELLQKRGLNLEAEDYRDMRPIHWAAYGDKKNSIIFLFNNDCSLKAPANEKTPLDLISNINKDYLKELIAKSKDRKNPMKIFPENLVFKGGGTKGILYVGVLKALESRLIPRDVKRVAGTSAGAITATLIALGLNSEKIEAKLKEKKFEDFLDFDPAFKNIKNKLEQFFSNSQESFTREIEAKKNIKTKKQYAGLFFNVVWDFLKSSNDQIEAFSEILKKDGFCLGDNFNKWIKTIIKEQTGDENCTFGKLKKLVKEKPEKFKHLSVCAYNMTSEKIEIFSSENKDQENIRIADAVRASMSIPGVFQPCEIEIKGKECRFVDGGVLNNLPTKTFDIQKYKRTNEFSSEKIDKSKTWTNQRTWAFNLYDEPISSEKKQLEEKKDGKLDFIFKLGKLYYLAEEKIAQLNDDDRIIPIFDQGVSTLDVEMTEGKQNQAIAKTKEMMDNKLEKDWHPVKEKYEYDDVTQVIRYGEVLKDLKKENLGAYEFMRFITHAVSDEVKIPINFFEIWPYISNNERSSIVDIKTILKSSGLIQKDEYNLVIPNNVKKNIPEMTKTEFVNYKAILMKKSMNASKEEQEKIASIFGILKSEDSFKDSKFEELSKTFEQAVKNSKLFNRAKAEEYSFNEIPFELEMLLTAGKNYFETMDYFEAQISYRKALEAMKHYLVDESIKIVALKGLVESSIKLNDYPQAIESLNAAVKITKRIIDKKKEKNKEEYENLLMFYKELSKCYDEIFEYKKATFCSQLAMEIEKQLNEEVA